MSEFRQRFGSIVARFLQTVVVFDDEPHRGDMPTVVKDNVVVPSGRLTDSVEDTPAPTGRGSRKGLDTGALTAAFAKDGLLCGVIHPREVDNGEAIERMIGRADIVVLDWQINGDDGTYAVSTIDKLVNGDSDGNKRLRLIAIYTGEAVLDDICMTIKCAIQSRGWQDHKEGDLTIGLTIGNCRIVLYWKRDAKPAPEVASRVVTEEELAFRLVKDFGDMMVGLLPGIVLTSLATVRDNAYRLLDGLDERLDPAFLCQRACSPEPSDAEAFVVGKIAGELGAIMEEAVAEVGPADYKAIELWMDSQGPRDRSNNLLKILKHGCYSTHLVPADVISASGMSRKNCYEKLTGKLIGNGEKAEQLDREFAWLASYRIIVGDSGHRLHLGTVIRSVVETNAEYLLCIQPRCDSVRLAGCTDFLFLELTEKEKSAIGKLVVRDSCGQFVLRSVDKQVVIRRFKPIKGVIEVEEGQRFVDVTRRKYSWLGELRPDFGQRIVQKFGSHLSRVAAEDSEWLRRKERS